VIVTRRRFCALPLAGLLPNIGAAAPSVIRDTSKPALIAVLSTGHHDSPFYESLERGLRAALPEFSRQLKIMQREARFSLESLARQTDELLSLRPDVLICLDLAAANSAVERRVDRKPSIVFAVHADPLAHKLIESYKHPGNNLTGINTYRCIEGKMVDVIANAFPHRKRFGYFLDSSVPDNGCMRQAHQTAARHHITLVDVDAAAPDFIQKTMIATLETLHLDGVIAPACAPLWQNPRIVVANLNKLRLPTLYEGDIFLDEGGLMYYGPDRTHVITQLATYVRQILLGEPAGELPVEQATVYQLVINLAAPHAADYNINATVLRRADQIRE
jgi:putative tryptophan/tyrosine transport system substrate-binding protein